MMIWDNEKGLPRSFKYLHNKFDVLKKFALVIKSCRVESGNRIRVSYPSRAPPGAPPLLLGCSAHPVNPKT